MAEDTKDNKAAAAAKKATAKAGNEPTAQEDRAQLDASYADTRDRGGRAAKVDKDPAEVQKNHADWLEGREPNDVVEVEGQRETAEARMARNGITGPEAQAGATHL